MNKTKFNIIFLAISQGANYLLPLMIFPYLVRVIGVEKFGDLSFSLITIQVLLLIVDYGFGYSGTRDVALNNDKVHLSTIFFGVILARLFLMLIAIIIILFICLIPIFYDVKILLYFGLISVIANVFNPNWYLQGRQMMGVMAVLSVVSRGIAVLLIYIIINKTTPIYISALLMTTPYIVYSFFGVIYLLLIKEVKPIRPSINSILDLLKKGFHFFCSTLATSAYTMLTPLVLGGVSGKLDVGVFNSANMIKQGLAGLASPVVQAFYPKINILHRDNPHLANFKAKNILKYLVLTYTILAIPFLLFAQPLSIIIFGDKGAVIYQSMRIMAVLPIFIGFNTVVGLLILVPNGMTKSYFKAISIGSVACLAVVFPACKFFGANGAVFSLMTAEVFVGAVMLRQLIKLNKSNRYK